MDQAIAGATDLEAAYRRILWRIMPLLVACYVAAYIDRSNVGLARLGFMHQLGFSETIYGIAGGTFYLGYSLSGIPSNLMVVRYGARLSLLVLMGLWGLVSAAQAVMQTPLHFYLLRFVIGAAEAGFLPGVLLFLSRWAPESRRARFNALFLAAIPISGVIGGPLAGSIMVATDNALGLAGWRWLFIVEGLPSCLIGILAYLLLAERPSEASWLPRKDRDAIEAEIADIDIKSVVRHSNFATAFRDPKFLLLVPMSISAIAGSAAIGLWLPQILRQAGAGAIDRIGWLTAIPYGIAIIAQYFVARSSDRCGERRWHSAIPIVVAGLGWLILPFTLHDVPVALGVMSLTAAGTFAVTGPFWTMPGRLLSPGAAAAGIAAITTCGGLGAFLCPLIVGKLSDTLHSVSAGAAFYGLLLIASAIVFMIGTRGTAKQLSV